MGRKYALCIALLGICASAQAELFDRDAPTRTWTEFKALGYEQKVPGIVFTDRDEICAGMPLGGLGTGCIDMEPTGVLGFSSVFQPSVKVEPTPYQTLRNAQLLTPYLAISTEGNTWVLASQKLLDGGTFRGCVDPVDPGNYTQNETYMSHWRVNVPKTEGVRGVQSIRYWGHFPIVDMDYETDAPLKVSLRAWAPFLPGDAISSGTPGAVFEIHLQNTTAKRLTGNLVFNFPGANADEAGGATFRRREVHEHGWQAIEVSADRARFAIAALDESQAKFGGNLAQGGRGWSQIAAQLPKPTDADGGASVSIPFELEPGQSQVKRFVLAWYIIDWLGGPYDEIKHFDETWAKNDFVLSRVGRKDRSTYTPKYAERYTDPIDVVRDLAARHEALLSRVIRWQQAVFDEPTMPGWLRSALVDNLSQFAEDSIWAEPKGEIAKWSQPLGAFQMIECPRTCSIVGCTASNYYGDLPTAYFFPELERQILRGYVAYMRPDGAVPFLYPSQDFTKPAFEWQIGLNGACFADLVHRLWLRTGDESVLQEFYPAVKKNMKFTVGLAPGEHGIVSFHREGKGQEWWEHTPVFGMVTHLAGVRMAQLRFAKDMAQQVGDKEFADQCEAWIQQASELTEKYLWNDKNRSYAFYVYPDKNMRNDDIMSSQLDGQWMTDLHGLPAVFRQDRIDATLQTVANTCMVDMGLAGFAEPGKGADLARYGTFPPEVNIVAMTYMYHGQRDLGLEIARRNMDNIIRVQGLGWDMPNLIRCDTGARTYGADYYQNMVLWGLPAALAAEDLTGPTKPGRLVQRVLEAAAK